MNFQIKLNHFPLIHDFPVQYLWIPPALALGASLLPRLMQTIFPLCPNRGPLATFRHEFAQIHYGYAKFKHPDYYHFIHVDSKDNLPLMLFIISLWGLKAGNQGTIESEPIVLTLYVIGCCLTMTTVRSVTSKAFVNFSAILNRAHLHKISRVCHHLSTHIAPSQVS